MKPIERSENFNLTTATETKTMGIDVNSTAHIISLLTDLYSDPAMAVIREYSTNALDSHIAAGQTRPIEIRVPETSYSDTPTFTVEDFGLGLSKDDITEVYSMYGSSTKRDTNEVTGMLGLGCKSGLTYAVSFTIDAVKDGWRTIASIAKDANGVGEIQILLHEETDSPNGVKVSIPVSAAMSFYQKVMSFFWYWRGGVLVNGEVPPNIDDDENWTQIDPDVYVRPRRSTYSSSSLSKIVQGGVAYTLNETREQYNSIVAYVPIGMVDFVPSREDVMHTSRTDEVIQDALDFARAEVLRTLRRELDECANDWQRIKFAKRMAQLLRSHDMMKEVNPNRFRAFGDGWGWMVSVSNGSVNRSKVESFNEVWANEKGGVEFVRNFDLKAFTNSHYDRLRAVGFESNTFVVLPLSYSERVGTASFPGVDWLKVPKIPREKSTTVAKPRVITEYICYTNQMTRYETEFSSLDDNICYVETSNRKNTAGDWWFTNLSRRYPTLTIVLLTPKQVPKFNRLFPHVKTKEEWVTTRKNLVLAKLTPALALALNTDPAVRDLSSMMKPHMDKIKSKRFKALLKISEIPEGLEAEFQYHAIDTTVDVDSDTITTKQDILEEYPLLQGRYSIFAHKKDINHMIAYINAIDSYNRRVA